MSSLSPSGSYGRRRRRPSVAVLLVALVVLAAAVAGYLFLVRGDDATRLAVCPSPSVGPSAAPSRDPALPAPATIAVRVLNTTNRSGLAKTVADELTKRGFAVGEVTNAPAGTVVPGVAEVRYAAQGLPSARVVAAQVGAVAAAEASAAPAASPSPAPSAPAAPITLVSNGAPGAGVDLLLGQSFDALLPVAKAEALLAPSPQPSATPTCVAGR